MSRCSIINECHTWCKNELLVVGGCDLRTFNTLRIIRRIRSRDKSRYSSIQALSSAFTCSSYVVPIDDDSLINVWMNV